MLTVLLIIIGLCAGSFINALVWRLYKNSRSTKKQLSILKGRSICPNCQRQLAAKDLIPIFSWLWLKGKCRYCNKPISVQYPIVELATTLLFVASYVYWPFVFNSEGSVLFIFWLIFLIGLIALTIYDIQWQLLPNKIIYPLIYIALAQALILLAYNLIVHELVGIFFSFTIGGGLFYAIFQISKGRWIGGGDVKLGALLGLILAAPSLSILMIFFASIIGTGVSLPLLATHKVKKTTRIPFGPFLIAGAVIARLFGTAIIEWYRRRLLY